MAVVTLQQNVLNLPSGLIADYPAQPCSTSCTLYCVCCRSQFELCNKWLGDWMCQAGIDPRAGEEVVETFAGTKQTLVTLTA